MTEKRFELYVNQHNQCDIVDWAESKEKNGICIYNDLGDYYFSSAKALCKLLNELHEEKEEIQKKMNRLYNYFEDFFSEEMGNDDFAEQWEFVADDEKWD